MSKIKINYFQLFLGILLNILTVIVFLLIYHAYIVAPKIVVDEAQMFAAMNSDLVSDLQR